MLSRLPSAGSAKFGKKRGNYNCGRCGRPKRGHSCVPASESAAGDHAAVNSRHPYLNHRRPSSSSSSTHCIHRSHSHLRRALSFDDEDAVASTTVINEEEEEEMCSPLPWSCLAEVLRRLQPAGLLVAAQVCRGWRDCIRRLWRVTEELRLRIPPRCHLGFAASVLQKCPGLLRLSLTIESHVDTTILACIAFSCPSLELLEIRTADTALNRINGDELSRFVTEKKCLSCLKLEGCTNLGSLNICSSSLLTLWLSDLYSISRTAITCPKLRELSLDFSRQENDSTDLVMVVDSFGRNCPRLRNVHIGSKKLNHDVVLSLANASLRDLHMLALVLGSGINDASVAAIVSSYPNLELLDLSGSSISDSGIGMICNVFPHSLCRLLLALCPNITSSGVQFATAQLPLLQLFDCGMSISELSSQDDLKDESSCRSLELDQERTNGKKYSMYQKLIIKHGRLKKLSLWGCSDLDALYLNCPQLCELNLNSCTNLHPERLLLQCPNLLNVHVSGCGDALVSAVENQVFNNFELENEHCPSRRSADGSKRVRVPNFLGQQLFETEKRSKLQDGRCTVHVQ